MNRRKVTQPGRHIAGRSCYLCRRSREGIDTERTIEGEGSLFLCSGCITKLGAEIGLETEAGHILKLARAEEACVAANERIAELVEELRAERELTEAQAVALARRFNGEEFVEAEVVEAEVSA